MAFEDFVDELVNRTAYKRHDLVGNEFGNAEFAIGDYLAHGMDFKTGLLTYAPFSTYNHYADYVLWQLFRRYNLPYESMNFIASKFDKTGVSFTYHVRLKDELRVDLFNELNAVLAPLMAEPGKVFMADDELIRRTLGLSDLGRHSVAASNRFAYLLLQMTLKKVVDPFGRPFGFDDVEFKVGAFESEVVNGEIPVPKSLKIIMKIGVKCFERPYADYLMRKYYVRNSKSALWLRHELESVI